MIDHSQGDDLAQPRLFVQGVLQHRADTLWTVLLSAGGYAPLPLPAFFGGPGWEAVPGDCDGDGLADPAVRKTDGSVWRVMSSGSGSVPLDVNLGLYPGMSNRGGWARALRRCVSDHPPDGFLNLLPNSYLSAAVRGTVVP